MLAKKIGDEFIRDHSRDEKTSLLTLKMRVSRRSATRHHSPAQKSRQLAGAQVAQLHTRNYAARFGLKVEANAERFFALGVRLAGQRIPHAIATQPT